MNKEIYNKVAEELAISPKVIEEAYRSFWRFVKTKISELPLEEISTKEEFEKLRTNFNIPSLGKLSCTYEKIENKKKIKEFKDGRVEE